MVELPAAPEAGLTTSPPTEFNCGTKKFTVMVISVAVVPPVMLLYVKASVPPGVKVEGRLLLLKAGLDVALMN